MILRVLTLILCFLTAMASSTQAIVIRHDRDESRYRELGKGFPMVCRVGDAQGTLIAPRWVLTAAHVAESIPQRGGTLHIAGRTVEVEQVFIHPDYAMGERHRDLALIKLAQAVSGVATARPYRGSDEKGMRVTFVGDGYFGTGKTGPRRGKRVRRAAVNTVTTVRPGWVTFRFDAPPGGDDLEGISGPGDSGGPALIERNGILYVIGVSAYNDGDPVCRYGTNEHYSRVSDEATWIDAVMNGELGASREPRLMRFGEAGGQATAEREEMVRVDVPAGADVRTWDAVDALLGSIHANDRAAYEALFSEHALAGGEEAGPLGMLDFMHGAVEKRGEIVSFHSLEGGGLTIPESTFPMRPVIFHMADGMCGYFGIAVDDAGKIDHLSLFVQPSICTGGTDCKEASPLKAFTSP